MYGGKGPRIGIEVEGETISLREVSIRYDMVYNTVKSRYHRGFRTIEELTKPVRKRAKNKSQSEK